MRIIVADDDPVSCKLLEHVITTRTEHEVTAVADGNAALELALTDPAPDILILDWVMPGMNGTEVCRRVRLKSSRVQPYVLLITAKNKRDEVIEGLTVGADDLIRKPIPPDMLIARLKLAAHRPRPGRPATRAVLQALVDARAEGDGELAIRSGDTTARVFFHRGKVAWAHLSEDPSGLFDILGPESGVDRDTAREVVEECRRTGARLSDTLVAFGLTDRARLRQSMLSWSERKIAAIRQLASPQMLFLPVERTYAEDLLFELEELVAPNELSSVRPSQLPPPPERPQAKNTWETAFVSEIPVSIEDDELMKRCMDAKGVRGVAVMDRNTGRCLGQRGVRLNPDIVWAHIQCLNATAEQDRVSGMAVVSDRTFHIVRVLPGRENTFVYALVARSKMVVEQARAHIEQAVLNDTPELETAPAD